MDATTLTALLHAGFGARAAARARRPNALYQVHVPAYLADGDEAHLYVRELGDGRLLMTDLGHTCMRLSYTRKITDDVRATLTGLARRHGFGFEEDRLSSAMPRDELVVGILGLIQIETEAEATIGAAVARGERSESFRAMVRDAIRDAFPNAVDFDFHEPGDTDALYKIDAMIRGTSTALGIAIASTNLDAERAVSAKLHLEAVLAAGPKGGAHPSGRRRWIVIPRDMNALDGKTRLRLMREYLVPVPKYEDEPERLAPKLRELAL